MENGSATMSFPYAPESAGKKMVNIALLDSSGAYQDGWVGQLEVSESSFKGSISGQIEGFFTWLWAAIRGILGL